MIRIKRTNGEYVFLAHLSRTIVPSLETIRLILGDNCALWDCATKSYVPLADLDLGTTENFEGKEIPQGTYWMPR